MLEDDDPTLRLMCRSWLTESNSSFLKILDPILTEFINNYKVYRSLTGQIFFLSDYNPKLIIANFKKLRNIVQNTQNEFIEYVLKTKLSNNVSQEFFEHFGAQIKNYTKDIDVKYRNEKYILSIVIITLQFITGQAVESMSNTLFQET